jgi:negative regulator of sigma E activity
MQDLEALMRDKLDTHCREQLSAMLDGELAPDQARFLLRRLQHDHELAGCWERWQLCGDLMRGSAPALLPEGFAERVRHALDAGSASPQAMAMAGSGARMRWLPWAGSAALAASVAAVALLVGRGAPTLPVAEPVSFDRVAATPANTVPLSDPPQPAGALPGTPEGDGRNAADAAAGALAATAMAAARPARRNERRTRGDAASGTRSRGTQRVLVAEVGTDAGQGQAGDAVSAVQADGGLQGLQASPVQAIASTDPLLVEVQATARPWPRSPLPGLTGGAFNAGLQDTRPSYEGFEPQLPLQGDPEPAAAESATP